MDTVLPAPDLARFTGRGHDAHRAFWRDLVAEIDRLFIDHAPTAGY